MLAAGLAWTPRRRRLRRILRALMATVDCAGLDALRAKYADVMRGAHPDSAYKYLDVAFHTRQKLLLANRLGLDQGPPRRVLDIGTGGGHFPFVCRFFGHEVVGIDVDDPLYDGIAACLGVQRTLVRVRPNTPLPALGGRFDVIVACNTTFNDKEQGPPRTYWSAAEWQYFLDDLLDNQLRSPGRLYVKLNKEYRTDAAGRERLVYNRDLLDRVARNGAAVDRRHGMFEFSLAARGARPADKARSSSRPAHRLRVLSLGSCRVHEPLAAAHGLGTIDYQNRRFARGRPVYLHDVQEAIQFVRLVRGETVMPVDLRPFAYESGLRPDHGMALALQQAECVVVEACTDKHYEAAGWTLNINEIHRQLVVPGGRPAEDWWQTIDAGQRPSTRLVESVEAELQSRWRTRRRFGAGHRRVLRELVFRYQAMAEIARGLDRLQGLLARPMLVVPHVAVRQPDGCFLAERLQHVAKTCQAASTLGLPMLDPRQFIDRHGQSRVLADGGSDFHHYAADYVPVVGCEIVRALREIV